MFKLFLVQPIPSQEGQHDRNDNMAKKWTLPAVYIYAHKGRVSEPSLDLDQEFKSL